MNKKSGEESVERRKRELQQKELENDIEKDMQISFQRLRFEEMLENSGNPYMTGAIRFFLTIGILYIIFIMAYLTLFFVFGTIGVVFPDWFGPVLAAMDPIIHALIWIVSIYSVYRKKSVIDDIVEYFT